MFDFHKLKMKPKPGQGMCPGQNWSPRCLHGAGGGDKYNVTRQCPISQEQ